MAVVLSDETGVVVDEHLPRSRPRFLGKVDGRSGYTYSVGHHLEDTEAVADYLVRFHPFIDVLAHAWTVTEPGDVRDLLCFLASVHDVGKFSDVHGYQQKCQAWLQRRSGRDAEAMHHTDAAHLLLFSDRDRLDALLDVADSTPARLFLTTATGHHGRASVRDRPPGVRVDALFSEDAREAAWSHLEAALARRPGAARVLNAIAEGTIKPQILSWPVAGFVVLCDWLASNTDSFPLDADRNPEIQAQQAVEAARVLPRPVAKATSEDIVRYDRLRPLQDAVRDIPISTTPGTYILEAETGSGKTEAALLLAHRLLQQGASGIYWALPTQATSNALHVRLTRAAKVLLDDVRDEDVVLAHGDRPRAEPTPSDDQDCASRRGGAWLADGLKRALLAPFAVGTLDQALMGALKVKHQCLRLLGLVGKVLVVDEVHAYDEHELTILEHLLAQHHAMGGHAILLSATLPSALRERLLRADVVTDDYPVVSWNHDEAGHLAVVDRMHKPKRVEFVHDADAALDLLVQAVKDGKAAAWIRNTVGEAAQAHEALAARDVLALLFHSRFTLADRDRIQKQVETTGAANRPEGGLVVIATQVVEQSLDVDFDLLVTDLCPADLIVQRLGRLHRHARRADGTKHVDASATDERDDAILYVHAPDGEPSADLFTSWSRGTAFIYGDHAILWRTLEALRARPHFGDLADLRDFVESVYAQEATHPACFQRQHEDADAQRNARGQVADWKVLPFEKGYSIMTDVGDDTETATRIGEPTTWVVLTRDGKPIHDDWRASRLRVSNRLLKEHGPGIQEGLEAALARQVEQGYVRAYDADAVGYSIDRGWVG